MKTFVKSFFGSLSMALTAYVVGFGFTLGVLTAYACVIKGMG